MITLYVLMMIWFLVSTVRIWRKCKRLGIRFNPFESTFLDYVGFIFGFAVQVVSIIAFCIFFLP